MKLAACACMALTLISCGKKVDEKPKTAEQLNTEKAAAEKMLRENPVYGEQVKNLKVTKELAKAAEEQAAETAKKIDDATK